MTYDLSKYMPIIKRSVDEHPENDAQLWRYMNLSQLLSIMEREQLWFCRADQLGDPYEGSLTQPRREIRDDQLKALKEISQEDDDWTTINRDEEELIKEQVEKNKRQREWIFINCWHKNKKESAAMWDLYSKSDEAIAIKTTFQRLASSLEGNEEAISLSKVRYLDFEEDDMIQGESTIDFLYKRKSFQHEREVRALFWDLPKENQMDDQPKGQYIDVDFGKLVEEIRISPDADDWFVDTVERVVTTPLQYGVDDNIVSQSDLSEDPLF